MRKDITPELLERFLNGKASAEESARVNEWYSSFDSRDDDERLHDLEENVRLQQNIYQKIRTTIDEPAGHRHTNMSVTLKWAASIALFVAVGISAYLFRVSSPVLDEPFIITSVEPVFRTVTNENSEPEIQVLSDGSTVHLEPNSSITFPSSFTKTERNVELNGEAFFDVAKEKGRPFVIATGDVTVRVLGTSFTVKAYEHAEEITVAVKTGKVLVTKTRMQENIDDGTEKEIILTPNQEVVYNTVNEHFERKLIDKPEIVLSEPYVFEMKYDGTPVTKIFGVLEANYGIEIEFDQERLSACTLTTTMAEEGFFERIEVICKAIGARYTVEDLKVIITSDGCQ